jgi:DNA modification methylase
VLDPFVGSGQTTKVAKYLKRRYIGVDNMKEYVEMAKKRLSENPHLREQLIAKWQKVPTALQKL